MSERIKVLTVVKALEKNGVTSVIRSYSKYIDRDIFQFDIVCGPLYEADIRSELESQGCKFYIIQNRDRKLIKYIKQLKSIVKSGDYDIVHVHGNSSLIFPELVAARIAGAKVRIAHSHNTMCNHPGLNKMVYPLFEANVTDRMACSNEAGKWMFHNKKFTVINNGIETARYKFDERERIEIRGQLGVNDSTFLVGHIGYFDYQKNHVRLISIFESLLQIRPDSKLVLVGDGEGRKEIERLIESKGLSGSVLLLGRRDDVPALLSAMDVFVLPSHFEGLGIVLIEAQASGLHCIASDVIPEEANVAEDVTFLSLNEDSRLWAKTIISSARDKKQRIYASHEDSRLIIKKNYDIPIVVKALEGNYKRLRGVI